MSVVSWPNHIVYSLGSGKSEAFVVTAKSHNEATELAKETFPELTQISRDRISFSIEVGGQLIRIAPAMLPYVFSSLAAGTLVYVIVQPAERAMMGISNPPAYSKAPTMETRQLVIFKLNDHNQAFALVKSTWNEAINLAKELFPSQLSHLPHRQISFSLRVMGGRQRLITPSAWWAVISAYSPQETYLRVYVHIEPEEYGKQERSASSKLMAGLQASGIE